MTEQETFDTVVNHLRTQNRKSIEFKNCKYRGPNGLKCAAGCLIPDEDYYERWEGVIVTPDSPIGNYFKDKGFNIRLIRRLQIVHDCELIDNWESHFQAIAKEFDLTYKEKE